MVERAWYASVIYDNGCRAEVWRSTQDEAWGWVQRQAELHVLLSSAVMDADRRAKSLAEMRAVHREADDLACDDWSPVHWFVDRLLERTATSARTSGADVVRRRVRRSSTCW